MITVVTWTPGEGSLGTDPGKCSHESRGSQNAQKLAEALLGAFPEPRINGASSAHFVGCKTEAFRGLGSGDGLSPHCSPGRVG